MKRLMVVAVSVLCVMVTGMAQAGEINLSAAASLKDALNEIIAGFAKEHPDVKVLTNYGASGALAKQVGQGAPADIFISANQKWLDFLVKEGKADAATAGVLAGNTLVVAGKKEVAVKGMEDLKGLARIAIGSPASVPAGQYAEQAMRKAGIYEGLEQGKKLVLAKDVRQALLYADRGEVDAAFVYRTDALLAQQAVILFEVPADLYDPVTYPMGLTVAGAATVEGKDFYAFLAAGEVQEILQKYGFTTNK
ncbi:MAG: molybdate ABC transporter substrate-binding protein [Desulfobulbaceae bacterium]|nr:MAG: molybdate ABC transporter substrate-binding protein [Desulfobulbaceae bacterium]